MSENNNFDNNVNSGNNTPKRRRKDRKELSHFDEDTLSQSNDFDIVESEDINYVQEEQRKKQRKFKIVVLIVVFAVLAAFVGGYIGFQQVLNQNETTETSAPSGPEAPMVERLPEGEQEIEVEEGENPMVEVFNGEPAPHDGNEIVELGNERFVFDGSQVMLEADDATLVETSGAECELQYQSEICYAGYIDFEDLDNLSVYASKNVAESRLLETMTETNTQSITGASAAVMGMLEAGEVSTPAIAVAAENGSGFILMFEDGTEKGVGDFSGYAPLITIHN